MVGGRLLSGLLGERKLRTVKHVAVGRSIVAKHKSAMHGETKPGLQIPSQAGLSEEKVLSKFLSPYQAVPHPAKGSRNSVADCTNFLLLPGVPVEQGAIFARVVEPPEKRGGYGELRVLGKPDPELVVACDRPFRRDASHLLVETSTPKASFLHDAAEAAGMKRSRADHVARKRCDT